MARNNEYWLIIASDFLFIVPLIVALHYNVVIQAIAILMVTVFAPLYHSHLDNELLGTLDVMSAFFLIGVNLYLVILGNFSWPFFYLALVLVPVSFYFLANKRKNSYNFALWHVASVFITLFSLLSSIN